MHTPISKVFMTQYLLRTFEVQNPTYKKNQPQKNPLASNTKGLFTK